MVSLREMPLLTSPLPALLTMAPISRLGVTTLTTTWVLVCIASSTVMWAIILAVRRGIAGLGETITAFAMVIAVGLACQMTAAIIIEGRGEHETDFSENQIDVLARV